MKTTKIEYGLYKLEYKDFNFGVTGGNDGGCQRWVWIDLTEDEESIVYFTSKKEAVRELKIFLDLEGKQKENEIWNCFRDKYYYKICKGITD